MGWVWCGWCVRASLPALQTLIVLSAEPETILVPSGEKATDITSLCCVRALFLRLELQGCCRKHRGGHVCGLKGLEGVSVQHTCIPHFDRFEGDTPAVDSSWRNSFVTVFYQ